MKKSFRPLAILLALLIIGLCFSFKFQIQEVRATYVWGPIDKDTVWTLVDSPFVISGDITVYPNATLTLEPAVEVRFGGNFSLNVEGTLVAKGTETANIKFTANTLDPNPGDWGTILLNDTNAFASLSNCIVEYGTSGITVETGKLTLEDSQVRFNYEDAIAIVNGTVEVSNSHIESNGASGIRVEGENQVLIHDDNFTSNADGVTLAGNLTSVTDIQQNHFLNNTHSGISLEAETYANTLIADNTLSANNYGFYVVTNGTSITHNYILSNTVGIFYGNGPGHEAHFNDISDNGMGMDVSAAAMVDATYNYWGDRSGPEHDSLNPHGKGNPVGGNGTNLDFIFFLTHPFEYSNSAPTAILLTDKTLVTPGENVTFIGTYSYDDGQVDQYFFDFDNGTNTSWITLSMFNYSYASPGTYMPSLQVTDDFNVTSPNLATADITVQPNLTPLNVAVALSNETVRLDSNVTTTVYVSTGTGPLSNANVKLLAVKGGSFTPASGSTDSNGYFTTVFTAPNVTEVSNIRIIASASMNGYADGSSYEYLKVLPPLNVRIDANPSTIESEGSTTVKVHVTDAFEEPVSYADLTLSVDDGTLSSIFETTDLNGTATFTFQAPQTLIQINATITVTASKAEYANGQSQQVITITPKLLSLGITADPQVIISEATSTITIHVAYGPTPVPDATLVLSSDIGGNFSAARNATDSNGNAVFIFFAPQITTHDSAVATINVTASKIGYVDAERQTTVAITPKILIVQMTAQPSALTSETRTNVAVHVTSSSDTSPVPEANVTITSDNGGSFNTTSRLTNLNGDVTFPFTAPLANAPLNVTVTASAQKAGYVSNQSLLLITVNPANLTIQIKASSQTVMASERSVIEVYVASNSTPVVNASVTMSSSYGNFSATTLLTDSNGRCTFVFNAPKTTAQLSVLITANVTKNGYVSTLNQTTISVIPETTEVGGGLSLITILLIVIPVIIVVIVVALVKLKVLSISFKEEEE
jgi:hypothetical protein